MTQIRMLNADALIRPLRVFLQCYFWKDESEDTVIDRPVLVEHLQWTDSEDVPCRLLRTLMELISTVLCAARNQQNPLTPASEVELELVEFVLDAIPVILNAHPYHDFSKVILSQATKVSTMFRQLFYSTPLIPQILDAILARSHFSTGTRGKLLLDTIDRGT